MAREYIGGGREYMGRGRFFEKSPILKIWVDCKTARNIS
jgi:hypothetical protein